MMNEVRSPCWWFTTRTYGLEFMRETSVTFVSGNLLSPLRDNLQHAAPKRVLYRGCAKTLLLPIDFYYTNNDEK